jgi:hypothetical protein
MSFINSSNCLSGRGTSSFDQISLKVDYNTAESKELGERQSRPRWAIECVENRLPAPLADTQACGFCPCSDTLRFVFGYAQTEGSS